jgi:hypothetical protein
VFNILFFVVFIIIILLRKLIKDSMMKEVKYAVIEMNDRENEIDEY